MAKRGRPRKDDGNKELYVGNHRVNQNLHRIILSRDVKALTLKLGDVLYEIKILD